MVHSLRSRFGWSKGAPAKIASGAHLEIVLDFRDEVCYTEKKTINTEQTNDDKNTFRLPRQHMPQPNGRVRNEGSGEQSWGGGSVLYRIRRYQYRGDR